MIIKTSLFNLTYGHSSQKNFVGAKKYIGQKNECQEVSVDKKRTRTRVYNNNNSRNNNNNIKSKKDNIEET
jgi:hypothetical protein